MKLSDKIRKRQEDAFPAEQAMCSLQRLYTWQAGAEDLEAETRKAWRAFYVACGVVGLVVVGALVDRHTQCEAVAPSELSGDPERNVMQLDPDTVITYPNRTIEI